MNIKYQISNIKFITITAVILLASVISPMVKADTVTDNAINYLKSKQDSTGRINTGFSAPSQWSTIAITAAGIDVSTVKNPSTSLKDFLLTDIPSGGSATDWENRILAIVAIGGDPTNFGGTNYVSNLQGFYTGGQIGDTCGLNDDIFGLLALIASGSTADNSIKQNDLSYLISKQDATDGGFSFSAPGCSYYGTSADITSAAIQALQAAKDNGMSTSGLDDSITKAKAYILANQDSDGGFGYYGTSDTDTTGWVLMALNVLGMNSSQQATSAKNYLISQQSQQDGGITAYDYGSSTYVSNATTTAQAVIGLLGKSWILKIYTPSASTSPAPSVSPSPSPSPSSSSSSSSSNSPSPSATPNPTIASPTPTPTPKAGVFTANTDTLPSQSPSPSPSPQGDILGSKTADNVQTIVKKSSFKTWGTIAFLIIGLMSLGIFTYKKILE
ncbi:MAG TPA: prenyltransferase/squalene oxidase repeat-containing protein [Candidatus Saccharimonadales bacterium]|nr:prenyltransferase/squalene oxidase repeat-containing protein [Candidatus Saccharimonadales bacterium]